MIWAILAGLAPTLVILLSLSGLISAAETSMTAASRGRMHQLERDGDRAARRVNRLISNQETMIGAILLANNVINIFASVVTTQVLGAAFPGWVGAAVATARTMSSCTSRTQDELRSYIRKFPLTHPVAVYLCLCRSQLE